MIENYFKIKCILGLAALALLIILTGVFIVFWIIDQVEHLKRMKILKKQIQERENKNSF